MCLSPNDIPPDDLDDLIRAKMIKVAGMFYDEALRWGMRDIFKNEGGHQPDGLIVAAIIAIILGVFIVFKWASN